LSLTSAFLLVLALALTPAPAQTAKSKSKTATKTKQPVRRPVPRPASKAGDLASLVRDWREAPTAPRHAAVEAYAMAHARDDSGALARLALGIGEVEQKNYIAAIADLKKVQGKAAPIADYTAYFLSLARVENSDPVGVVKDLAATHNTEVRSPLAARAWIVEARALQLSDAPAAVRLLREHYSELPQPDGDVTLADSYQAAKDLPHATEFYQRVFYQYVSGEAANRAAAALLTLKDAMGANFPQPLPEQSLRRADRLLDARDYPRARSEYDSLADQLPLARVGIGAVDFLAGKQGPACSYLRNLDLADSDADAERLYYLEECARRSHDDDAMMAAVAKLGRQYPKSQWRLKAILAVTNRFLVTNRPDDYVPLYKALYENFPDDSNAGICHWRVVFQAYLHDRNDATDLIRDHLRSYPGHATTGAALYFLGRRYEKAGDFAAARAVYSRLSQGLPNHYYAMIARDRLARPELSGFSSSAETSAFLADLKLANPKPVSATATRATLVHIDRSRLLRTAGLADLADSELRFGSRTDGQGPLLGIEMAEAADFPHQAIRIMKGMSGDYLNLTLDQAPRKFWELLFPLPYRADLMTEARSRELDPFLMAGLIRQESEFNPGAVSRANAYGLTQVLPATGRQFAKKAGVTRFTSNLLFQPATNLKIGSSILRSMLDRNGGRVEETLAGYNAGPARAAEWLGWRDYREPAEFVESIPYTETRDYVQAVLRNADMYRRLYR